METDLKNFNLGAIDVGSNASRLLIKNVGVDFDGNLKTRKLLFLRIPLRLGMEVFKNGKISDTKEEEFIRTMKAYKLLMKVFHVMDYRACCTSAMRDAKNGKDVIKDIRKETDMKIDIISGDEESDIIYDSHLSMFQEGTYLYVDVGGGSTETTFITDGKKILSKSYNIGTIRMLNGAVKESEFHEMRAQLSMVTEGYDDIQIIGSGGNIGKLYRIAEKSEKQVDKLPVETLRKLYNKLEKMSIEERIEVYNMKPDRADVIVPAAEIFLAVAESIRAKMILVPNLGLVDGLINDLAKDILKDSKKD